MTLPARPLKTIVKAILIFVFLTQIALLANGQESHESGMYSTLYIPLLNYGGHMTIREVPVRFYGSLMESMAATMCAPVYSASSKKEDYKNDINLVSKAGIQITFKYLNDEHRFFPETEMDMLIDLDGAVKPKGVKVELYDIVQALLTCMRINYPPGSTGKINIKCINSRDTEQFRKLEGPLWSSDYIMPEAR